MEKKLGILLLLWRGMKKRCPRCGKGKLYEAWYRLQKNCSQCGYLYYRDPIDILSFMYMSTALLTGLFILLMFSLTPSNLALGRVLIGILGFFTIVGTLPQRKGIAIAIEYWTRTHLEE
ncbi:MAG: DUF983 domain-containing protein [Deltaproteobacteria bacterium]|nr:DUF983 domain-containing protein [Deltaproteobacteria bacterium]